MGFIAFFAALLIFPYYYANFSEADRCDGLAVDFRIR